MVYINSDKITPVDSGKIPTGAFADVTGTTFDFRKPMVIGARINDPVLQYDHGYDNNGSLADAPVSSAYRLAWRN